MKMLDIYEKCDIFRRAEGGEISIDTASLFTCGIMLKEIFFSGISFMETEEYSFEEVWFMLCQYHDENMESPNVWRKVCSEGVRKSVCEWEWNHISVGNDWKPMCLNFSPLFHYVENGIQYTNGLCIRNCMYTKLQIKDYFYYRNICCGENGMDHGIVGGLLLYEFLTLRRLQAGKNLDKYALNLYSYAANTMVVHNLCQKQKGGRKITFGEDPLLFLLLLAEVMEPLQYMRRGTDCRRALQAVEVRIYREKLVFCMNPEYFDMYELEKKMEGLKKRLKICYEILRDISEICISV